MIKTSHPECMCAAWEDIWQDSQRQKLTRSMRSLRFFSICWGGRRLIRSRAQSSCWSFWNTQPTEQRLNTLYYQIIVKHITSLFYNSAAFCDSSLGLVSLNVPHICHHLHSQISLCSVILKCFTNLNKHY